MCIFMRNSRAIIGVAQYTIQAHDRARSFMTVVVVSLSVFRVSQAYGWTHTHIVVEKKKKKKTHNSRTS